MNVNMKGISYQKKFPEYLLVGHHIYVIRMEWESTEPLVP